jgi:hypothetical protein
MSVAAAAGKYPFKVTDNTSGLCWTAQNPYVVNTTFTLQPCQPFPLPDNQRFSRLYTLEDTKPGATDIHRMTILDATVPKGNPLVWDENSLCLSFYKNVVTTVRCGKKGTNVLTVSGLGSACFGPDHVDKKTIVSYPCPHTSITCDNNTNNWKIPKCQ